jgi:hypothetical protein
MGCDLSIAATYNGMRRPHFAGHLAGPPGLSSRQAAIALSVLVCQSLALLVSK